MRAVVVAPGPQRVEVPHLGCGIHTRTPAQKSYTNFILYPFLLLKDALRTGLGMGMGTNVTAHHLHDGLGRLDRARALEAATQDQERPHLENYSEISFDL